MPKFRLGASRVGRAVIATAIAVAAASAAPALASAATFTVNTTADSNDSGGCVTVSVCSFYDAQGAAQSAGAGSVVVLPAGTYKATAVLGGNGDWSPDGTYTIQGAGPGKTIIDGNHLDRVFALYGTITMSGVTVTGGVAPNAGCTCGGAFEVRQGGDLTLINSVVEGNSAPAGGAGIDVDYQSKATLSNDLISQNTSPAAGAGIHVGYSSTGPMYGRLTMTNVTISGNSTTAGANGAGLDNAGMTTGSNITFAGNVANGNGGGVQNESSGILGLTNTTIATNIANVAGAGIDNLAPSSNLTLRNTIVADGCSGAVDSQGHNLDAGTTCGFTTTGDMQNANPKLGPLGDNGGPLPTLALLTGSPAINAGDNSVCPATDERGEPRPQAGVCDIGAYEYAPPAVVLGAASAVGVSGATVSGTVNPNLRDATYTFEYGPTTSYGSATPTGDAGSGDAAAPAGATLAGLAAGTTYHYRLVATNGDGTTVSSDGTFTTAHSPATPTATPPSVSQPHQSASKWYEGNSAAQISRKHKLSTGTKFTFTLNEAAQVTFAFTQRLHGRRVHGRCVTATQHNKGKPKCTATTAPLKVTFTGHAGLNTVKFAGRWGSHKLKPGTYTLVITASLSGQTSAPRTLTFTIVKR